MDHLRHHNIAAWKHADALFFEVHRLVMERFPKSERYELGSQLRRAALSVPANIVEGLARRSDAEQLQFLRTAWSSLLETDYFLSVALRLGYIDADAQVTIDRLTKQCAAALVGLMNSFRQ